MRKTKTAEKTNEDTQRVYEKRFIVAVMRMEREIDDRRTTQRVLLLGRIRQIQARHGAEKGKIFLEIRKDDAMGCSVDAEIRYEQKRPMSAGKLLEEINDLLSDYNFIFAGSSGRAEITRESHDISFIS